jgi:hypothetical protein
VSNPPILCKFEESFVTTITFCKDLMFRIHGLSCPCALFTCSSCFEIIVVYYAFYERFENVRQISNIFFKN